MANILVLEDLEDSYQILNSVLGAEHQLFWCQSVFSAKRLFNDNLDLLILDIGLPDGDGFEFCSWVRNGKINNDIPILFVSAKDSVECCVTGLMAGGDDYIKKPFHIAELKARVDSKLRFLSQQKRNSLNLSYDGVTLDLDAQRAFLDEQGRRLEIELTPIEFKILHLFMGELGKAFSRDEILDKIWGASVYVYPRSVDTHVSKLRKKLKHKSYLLKSIHGRGYQFGRQKKERSLGTHYGGLSSVHHYNFKVNGYD